MTTFEFASAARIVFGPGTLGRVGAIAASLGRSALVVTGGAPERFPELYVHLAAAGLSWTIHQVVGEPTIACAEAGAAAARAAGAEVVVAIGGGSALDAGKAIAALMRNRGPTLDYLEVVGRGRPLAAPSAPVVAIPTTAGTGSEVTRNAVLAVPERAVKVSLRSATMLPAAAIVDPLLTLSLPPQATAECGLDALTQVIEPFVSRLNNPLTDAICREGIRRGASALQRAYVAGDDLEARSEVALCSLFGGLALANAKLGAVHGFAGPLGGAFDAPHGAICARLLPLCFAANARALAERGGAAGAALLARHAEVARLVTGDPDATIADGVRWLEALARALRIRPLRAFGVDAGALPSTVAAAQASSSMQGNPIALTTAEMTTILEAALEAPT
jgi:alcohol dehydrogenase class IV